MQKTVLYETHRQSGARMVDFGGWEMPLHLSLIHIEMCIRDRCQDGTQILRNETLAQTRARSGDQQ